MKGLSECKSSENNIKRIRFKDIVKEVEDYLKTYSSAGMDISWFLVFLDGLEPYLLKTLEDGPFVPMSSLSTSENPLPKRQNQWSNAESRLANQDKRLKSIIISCLPNDVMKSVIKCKTAKEMWNDLILAHEGPSDTRDTKIAALRLKFNAFKSLEGEKVNGTFTRLKCLLNDLENNGVTIPQAEVNATFVNSLPRKWLSMNQTQRANNSIKNDSLATLYGKYNYEEGLIDQIYESETQRGTIQVQASKALSSKPSISRFDSIKEDQRTSNEFMADLNVEYHERAPLANQKRFYKRSGRVGSTKKPLDKTKETCYACGKFGHFQKDCPSHKTSTPSYPSSNNSFNKSKPYTPSFNQTSSQNSGNHQKDYKGKYRELKDEMVVLTKRIDDITKGKSEKGKLLEIVAGGEYVFTF
ncbi:retrovirus-related pol polyprotein from transposon TNT 1-94 [Tanacetum coccineum]